MNSCCSCAARYSLWPSINDTHKRFSRGRHTYTRRDPCFCRNGSPVVVRALSLSRRSMILLGQSLVAVIIISGILPRGMIKVPCNTQPSKEWYNTCMVPTMILLGRPLQARGRRSLLCPLVTAYTPRWTPSTS